MLAPALSQHVFFAQFQHREPADFSKIMGDTGFDHHVPISSRQPTRQTSFETKLSTPNLIVNLVSKHYYLRKERLCQHANRRNSWCKQADLFKPRAMANSAPPNGWRFATSPAPTASRAPHRRSRSFKRRHGALLQRPSRPLWQGGIWSDSSPRRMGEVSVCT